MVDGFCCSEAHGIFLDQGSKPCLLHWQADSLPLSHKGSPCEHIFWVRFIPKCFNLNSIYLLAKGPFRFSISSSVGGMPSLLSSDSIYPSLQDPAQVSPSLWSFRQPPQFSQYLLGTLIIPSIVLLCILTFVLLFFA